MKLAITRAAIADERDAENFRGRPDFRKATRNMCLVQAALEKFGEWNSRGRRVGVVLGTSHGELSSTADFLSELGIRNVARPFLFQNSLHNSTLGFITQRLQFTGPSFTVSNQYFSGERSLELAHSLLVGNLVDSCLVVGVDSIAAPAKEALRAIYPDEVNLGEGAAAILLERDESPQALGYLAEVNCHSSSVDKKPVQMTASYYDSDAIQHLVQMVLGRERERTLVKPDGTSSLIRVS